MSNIDMNVSSMNVGAMIRTLSDVMAAAVLSNRIAELPSIMLWGAPGVGKSQGVKQLALAVSKLTGKRTNVTDARLLLFNPVDLRGIPTSDADKKLAIWLKPKIFDMETGDDVINFLFLDEISAAPLSVQAAAYQITLDKTIGEHKLPNNCFVIAAGNRLTDRSVVYKMPRALANRLCHIEIKADFDSFKRWAVKRNVNPQILGYLSFAPQRLLSENPNDEVAFATPRSWEMVDTFLKFSGGSVAAAFDFIAGVLGLGQATEFRSWVNVYQELPNIEDIFEGRCAFIPQKSNVLYAITSSMVPYAVKYRQDRRKLDNALNYAVRLPADFAFSLIKDFCAIEGVFIMVKANPNVLNWIRINKKYIDNFGD